jgi:hypothetical protein
MTDDFDDESMQLGSRSFDMSRRPAMIGVVVQERLSQAINQFMRKWLGR